MCEKGIFIGMSTGYLTHLNQANGIELLQHNE